MIKFQLNGTPRGKIQEWLNRKSLNPLSMNVRVKILFDIVNAIHWIVTNTHISASLARPKRDKQLWYYTVSKKHLIHSNGFISVKLSLAWSENEFTQLREYRNTMFKWFNNDIFCDISHPMYLQWLGHIHMWLSQLRSHHLFTLFITFPLYTYVCKEMLCTLWIKHSVHSTL